MWQSFRNYNLNSAIIIQQRTQFLSWRSWKVARLRPLTSQNVFIQLLISKFLLNVAFPGTCVKTNIQKHIDKIKKIRQLINNSHSAAESKKFSFTFYSIQKKKHKAQLSTSSAIQKHNFWTTKVDVRFKVVVNNNDLQLLSRIITFNIHNELKAIFFAT